MGITYERVKTRTSINCWALLLKSNFEWTDKARQLDEMESAIVYDDGEIQISVMKLDCFTSKGKRLYRYTLKTDKSVAESDNFSID